MMTLNVLLKTKSMAKAIARELLSRELISSATITENAISLKQNNVEQKEENMIMLITVGKSMHYAEATTLIKQMFPKVVPVYYSNYSAG